MSKFVNPRVQRMNLIRYIGDKMEEYGGVIPQFGADGDVANQGLGPIQSYLKNITGAPNTLAFNRLMDDLESDRIVIIEARQVHTKDSSTGKDLLIEFRGVSLSPYGWEIHEEEKRGKFDGKYGFVAMQFGDDDLDAFVRDVVKPTVKDGIGYELVDMRDVSRAGVIDDIMRIQIRDAAFVIADLTHDNPGAYWEAGYAAGLGKTVIYICEQTKFDKKKSHFDTNHCTTVLWSRNNAEGFREKLVATLRRSLNL